MANTAFVASQNVRRVSQIKRKGKCSGKYQNLKLQILDGPNGSHAVARRADHIVVLFLFLNLHN
jgi:hypothetical protein